MVGDKKSTVMSFIMWCHFSPQQYQASFKWENQTTYPKIQARDFHACTKLNDLSVEIKVLNHEL